MKATTLLDIFHITEIDKYDNARILEASHSKDLPIWIKKTRSRKERPIFP
jgi:hypothetical protein